MRRRAVSVALASIAAPTLVLTTAVAGVARANAPACTITGTSGPDTLLGTDGPDVICGLGGNDIIRGLRGRDLLLGGPGDDQLFGGAADDELRGDDGFDWLQGDDGRDAMYGGPSGDTFNATKGSAAGVVGDGTDVMVGGAGLDTARYRSRTTSVSVSLDGVANDGAPGEGDAAGRLVNGVNDVESIESGTGSDILRGDDGPNFLVSRGGADDIAGGGGDDTIDTLDRVADDDVRAGDGQDYCAIDATDPNTGCETIYSGA